jgi:hypothetical protein
VFEYDFATALRKVQDLEPCMALLGGVIDLTCHNNADTSALFWNNSASAGFS